LELEAISNFDKPNDIHMVCVAGRN